MGMGLFLCFHLWLISNNLTTLELLALGIRNAFKGGALEGFFDIGKKKNFQQVFGTNPFLWFIPVYTSYGNGCQFPVNRKYQ